MLFLFLRLFLCGNTLEMYACIEEGYLLNKRKWMNERLNFVILSNLLNGKLLIHEQFFYFQFCSTPSLSGSNSFLLYCTFVWLVFLFSLQIYEVIFLAYYFMWWKWRRSLWMLFFLVEKSATLRYRINSRQIQKYDCIHLLEFNFWAKKSKSIFKSMLKAINGKAWEKWIFKRWKCDELVDKINYLLFQLSRNHFNAKVNHQSNS